MGKISPVKQENEERGKPVNIGDRAIDNVRFIREMMERSSSFTAVPGYGGILMGVTAAVAAYIANGQVYLVDSLWTWLIEACLAFAIGFLAMWQKSKIAGQSLFSTPARKFAFGFTPPLVVGVVVVLGLWRYGAYSAMAPVAMLCYGAAVACGGAYSVRVVPIMGWLFIAVGAVAFILPSEYGNLMMGVSFGLLHIVFGAIIARWYGG
ncbi:MAG: hypothetical protein UZ17_ACD001000136 [Acidobacteria bacterium OLB17]|nr:MAG: hypothetical protein UZ17_ACD001000136 [Acidobacteria bacterium OLB17]MCZ2391003.1 hypothetical protein [Acidobacteriota bacterium]